MRSTAGLEVREGLEPVGRRERLVSCLGEPLPQPGPDAGVVIHDENFGECHGVIHVS